MATAQNVTTARAATEPRHAAAAHFRPARHSRHIPPLPSPSGAVRATPQLLRTAAHRTVLLALRTAHSAVPTARSAVQRAVRIALPALLLALTDTRTALRTAWQTRGVWGPALLGALRNALTRTRTALRTAWQTRGVWGPALLHAVRDTPVALCTAWRTRGVWGPALLGKTRAGLAEAWAGARARPIASPAALLLIAALVTTVAAARPVGLGSPRIAPAAHTTPKNQTAHAQADQAAQAPAQAAVAPAPAPAPQCTVPATPAPPAGVTDEQIANARTIAQVAHDRGLSERAVVIALATAAQESKLLDIDYGDRDSLGLFQQRPSQGWGSPQQLLDPAYAAGKFYDQLVHVPGWDTGRLTDVAQAVQRSGFPEAYQKWEGLATALASSVTPAAPVCS